MSLDPVLHFIVGYLNFIRDTTAMLVDPESFLGFFVGVIIWSGLQMIQAGVLYLIYIAARKAYVVFSVRIK